MTRAMAVMMTSLVAELKTIRRLSGCSSAVIAAMEAMGFRVTHLYGLTETYGPATLWRMAAHVGYPRYPYRFGDGSLIRVIGDAVWWKLLESSRRPLLRLPLIIGHYRSNPSSQAEFRTPAAAEFEKLAAHGLAVG